jgi:oligopeptidase B
VKRKEVPGFNPDDYATSRVEATADDGAKIPISLVYHKSLLLRQKSGDDATASSSSTLPTFESSPLSAPAPMHLYGYGSYGVCIDAEFR